MDKPETSNSEVFKKYMKTVKLIPNLGSKSSAEMFNMKAAMKTKVKESKKAIKSIAKNLNSSWYSTIPNDARK